MLAMRTLPCVRQVLASSVLAPLRHRSIAHSFCALLMQSTGCNVAAACLLGAIMHA